MKKIYLINYALLSLLLMFFLKSNAFAQDNATYKLMMGYQGWFLAQGDGSAPNRWVHWFNSSVDPSASQIGIDFWPAMDEYKDTYNTNMTYLDGSTAKLYSAYDSSTINVHFRWMKEYGIHGVYLQRFLGPVVPRGDLFESRNKTLENVIGAADLYDRHFAVMYDISGVADDGNLFSKLISDWEYLVDTYDVLNKEGYLYQDDRPVIAIWGIGFNDRGLTPATFEQIIDYFHNTADPKYQAYVMGGVPSRWRTLEGDSESDPAWENIYNSLDMISPWTVGRYDDQEGIDSWKDSRIIPDLNTCFSNGVDYMPVIWPGFSWKNIHDGPLNQIPRDGGNYFWRQAYNAVSVGCQFIYVAMFDEVDEGTAMFKMAENKSQVPVEIEDRIVTLDADGYDLPGDWYLRLAGEAQKMLNGNIALTSSIPIKPYDFREHISPCETKIGWSSDNSLSVNKTIHKRGTGALQSKGSAADEFRRNFLTSFSAGTSTAIGFWYYISDISKFDEDNQVELGSGGEADANEYYWTLDNTDLKNGWNYIKLDFTDAMQTGNGPNTEEFNWFRIYRSKSGTVTTLIDDIKFIGADGVYIPVANAGPDIVQIDNNEDGNEPVILDASASLDFDGNISSYTWEKDGLQIASGVNAAVNFDIGRHLVALTVTDNDGNMDKDQITISIQAEVDNCDSKTGWTSSNTLMVNTTDQKKGTGCLQSSGTDAEEFSKQFLSSVSADSSTTLGFWYYVSDITAFESENQVELGSGGKADLNEYNWSLDNLVNGWNYVLLNFNDAEQTGGAPDLTALNWFRIYHSKNKTVTTRIDDIRFLGSGGNLSPVAEAGPAQTVKSDGSGLGTVILDGSQSFDADGTIMGYSWTENDSVIATGEKPTVQLTEGSHSIILTVTDNDGASNEDQVIITVDGDYFDDCDVLTDWNSANLLTINTIDHKQGNGCLQAAGSSTDDYKKVFAEKFSITAFRSLEFWYYVSDVNQLSSSNQLEIGSAGRPDMNEYNWNLNNLEDGWNHIVLNFADAGITGDKPDLAAINWFRLYRFKNGEVTTRIDGLKFTGVNESPVADAGIDRTVTDDDENGFELIVLDGSGSTDPDGSILSYSWTEDGHEIATGVSPTVNLSVGTHKITLTVTDDGGATHEDQLTIDVESVTGVNSEDQIPKTYTLNQNYPNPFNPSTMIIYGVPKRSKVKIEIFNVLGKSVVVLENGVKRAGYHKTVWDAHGFPSGIYMVAIKSNSAVLTKKMILLK